MRARIPSPCDRGEAGIRRSMSLFRCGVSSVVRLTFIVLALVSSAWSEGATLDRHVWVGFDGDGLRIEDEMECGIRSPGRFSTKVPWILESVEHEQQQVVLSSLEPLERGFPVGGNAHLFVSSSLNGNVWQSIPFSPAGWDFDEVRLTVHHGPGWMLLAVLGGGTGEGAWLDGWTLAGLLGVAGMFLVLGFMNSWRAAGLLGGGLAMAGPPHPWLLVLFAISILAVGGLGLWIRRRPLWRRDVHIVFVQLLLAWGLGFAVFTYLQVQRVVDPSVTLRAGKISGGIVDTTDDQVVASTGPRHITLYRKANLADSPGGSPWDTAVYVPLDTTVDEEYGEEGQWGRHRPGIPASKGGVVGGILPEGSMWRPGDDFWIPDEDPGCLGTASLGMGSPHWSPVASTRKWSPPGDAMVESTSADGGSATPAVVRGDACMRLILLAPPFAALWQILTIALLWSAWFCVAGKLVRRWPVASGSGAGGLRVASALVLLAAVGGQAADSACGIRIVRQADLGKRTRVTTRVVAIGGSDSVLRIPLFPGERPVDSLRIEEGMVVLSRKSAHRKVFHAYSDIEDGFWVRRIDTIDLSMDSLRSGTWKGVTGGGEGGLADPGVGWISRFDPDASLLLRAGPSGGPCESWGVTHSQRWSPVFEGIGMEGGGRSGFGHAIEFLPEPSDSLRIRLRRAWAVPLVRTHVHQARWTFSDFEMTRSVLDLRLRVASSDTLRLDLPQGVGQVECWRNRKKLETRKEADGRFAVELVPGSCAVRVAWRSAAQTGWLHRPPRVTLSVGGQDASLGIPVDSGKWIPALHGPGLGPSEGWWMGLIAFAIPVFWLRWKFRIRRGFLDFAIAWLGASFVSPALVVALVLVVGAHLPKVATEYGDAAVRWSFVPDRYRKRIALLAMVGLLLWFVHLLVRGPVSPAVGGELLWFTDVAGPELIRPWLVVLPGWMWTAAVASCMFWLVLLGFQMIYGLPIPGFQGTTGGDGVNSPKASAAGDLT